MTAVMSAPISIGHMPTEHHRMEEQHQQSLPSQSQMETISESETLAQDSNGLEIHSSLPNKQIVEQPSPTSYQASSFSSSQHFSSELPESILEEGAESGSDSPIEPVTPISGRQSQDFNAFQNHKDLHQQQQQQPPPPPSAATQQPTLADTEHTQLSQSLPTHIKAAGEKPKPESTNTQTSTFEAPPSASINPPRQRQRSEASIPAHSIANPDQPPPALSRRSTRGSTSSFKRTMSNLFRRSNSHYYKDHADPFHDPENVSRVNGSKIASSNHSDSPGSPGSDLEMPATTGHARAPLPGPEDFKKKNRASTGLALRSIKFVGSHNKQEPRPPKLTLRRASSFDSRHSKSKDEQDLDHLPWAMIPDAGTGAKSRRLSLSLPDDFTVDVADLMSEFEYQSKFLGRHGKGLGKGAGGKVNLMLRKGFTGELYAAKQFRNKSRKETQEEYDQKIKSEFSIAKSLHHPNVIESIRLCTDHGRFTHVMEYCSGGDLYNLLKERPLTGENFQTDRLCIFKQIVQGVAYLHDHGIAHRDLKLENILMTGDSKVKITDFGVSEVFSGTHPGLRESGGCCGKNMGEVRLCSPGICGSEPSIPPEILEKKSQYDPRGSDVWGTAIIMVCLTFGGYLWNRAERGGQYPMYDIHYNAYEKWHRKHPEAEGVITETSYPRSLPFDKKCNPPALKRILLQMLNPDPAKRITIQDVLQNRFVKNIECCQLPNYDDPALVIDATKKNAITSGKIFCHTHVPSKVKGSHSLGKMPGSVGY